MIKLAKEDNECVTLFLMTEKGFEFLSALIPKYKNIFKLIVVGSDKNLQNDYEDEIINLCKSNQIPWVKKNTSINIETEYVFAVSWKWHINHPQNKLIIFHDSLLPKYRGYAPLVNTLIKGEKEIGVTAIFGASVFDTGDIIAQSKSIIDYPIKINEAIKINNANYINCAITVIDSIAKNKTLAGNPQNLQDASYSIWLDEKDYLIDWSLPSTTILRFINSVGYPYKGACTKMDGEIVRIFDAEEWNDIEIENRHYGKVIYIHNMNPVVICGKGLLKIKSAFVERDANLMSLLPLNKFRIRFES
jgi:methionyl-tRNA formyltransferase